MPGGAGAAQPPELSTTGVQAWGVPRHCPGEAARPEGHRGGQAGSGPPLQTLTLFSQVRRQFPWKQPGAETGTRIQKCEALSSSSPSWIPAPHDPSWVLAPTLLPPCVGVWGCPAWAPGLGCSSVPAHCSIHGHGVWGWAWCPSRDVQGVLWEWDTAGRDIAGRGCCWQPHVLTSSNNTCTHLWVKVLHRGGRDALACRCAL